MNEHQAEIRTTTARDNGVVEDNSKNKAPIENAISPKANQSSLLGGARLLTMFAAGVAVGWLSRNLTTSAREGAMRVATAIIIAVMIAAMVSQLSLVIVPVLLQWREVRKREAYITDSD
jgi:hypothetical protein